MLALGIGAFVACGAPAGSDESQPQSDIPRQERLGQGEAIAENLCASCHAIDRTDESPHPDAIPFRVLSRKYPVRSLAEPLSKGIIVGHPDMPEWQFEPRHVESLLTYIESIQDPQDI
ncbi:c-type cytochrome [Henriciella aquimarina]|uniref:c-type cytochrome n=1 Tax=Henriciella aquimarina TaxID=545261 RepID=UPI00117AE086|nr:cytochrome c [Henriciella aquimarina]